MRPADGLDADLSSYEAEMETEMLRNAADGLCIALLEPARALAHAALSAAESRIINWFILEFI